MQPLVPDSNIDVPTDTIIALKAGEQLNIPIDAYKGSATPTATLVDVFGTVRAVPAKVMRIAEHQWIVVKSANLELVTGNIVVRLADSVVLSAVIIVYASKEVEPDIVISTCREHSEQEMAALCGVGGCVVEYDKGRFRRLDVATSTQTRVIMAPQTSYIVGLVDGSGLFRHVHKWNFRTTSFVQLTIANRVVTGRFVRCLPTAEYKVRFTTALDTIETILESDIHSFPMGLATDCKVVIYENGRPVDSSTVTTSIVKAEMVYSLSADVRYTTTLHAKTSSGTEYDRFPGTTEFNIPEKRVTKMMLRSSILDFFPSANLVAQFENAKLLFGDGKVSGVITFTQSFSDGGRTFVGPCRLEFRDARLVTLPSKRGYIVDMYDASYRLMFTTEIIEGMHTWTLDTDPTWLPARDVLAFSFAESAD